MPFLTQHASFRRIVATRILLLLVPVVSLGEWTVYTKARQSLVQATQEQLQAIAHYTAATNASSHPVPSTPGAAGVPGATGVNAAGAIPAPQLTQGLQIVTLDLQRATQGSANALPAPTPANLPNLSGFQLAPSANPTANPSANPSANLTANPAALWQQILRDSLQPQPSRLSNATSKYPWLVGYALRDRPGQDPQIVIALLPRDRALETLREMRMLLVGVTALLLLTGSLVACFVAREVAAPLEALRDYARAVSRSARTPGATPTNLGVPLAHLKGREVHELAEALEQVLEQLTQRSHDLEIATQEAQSASRLKTQFLAATSHELRTPLNAIIGHLHLVRDGCCDDRAEEIESLLQAEKAALHQLNVLNDLLDIARIEAGEYNLNPQLFDLRGLIRDVLKLQQPHLTQKGIGLNVALLNQPLMVFTDPAKCRQVFLNIVANAIKFTDQGSIAVTTHIQHRPESDRPRWIQLQVTDTGIGIATDQQQQLFRPFARAQRDHQRPHEGSGLGLVICRTLMERMGGEIHLHSAGLGQGTTVEFLMPLCDPPVQMASEPLNHFTPQLFASESL